jgi:hypothetical protein
MVDCCVLLIRLQWRRWRLSFFCHHCHEPPPPASVVIAWRHHDHLLIQLPLMFADVVLGRVVVAADGVIIIAPLALWSLPNRRCWSPLLVTHHRHCSLIILSPRFL